MENLNEAFYACPALRIYPIDTKESAVSSFGAYCMRKNAHDKASQELIEANFRKAAAFYGIELAEPDQEPAAPVLYKEAGAENGVMMAEIRSMDDLDKAVDFILAKRASGPRVELAAAAKHVLWKAANNASDLDSERLKRLARIAGVGVGSKDAVLAEFDKRAKALPLCQDDKNAFLKYANELAELPDDVLMTEKNLNAACAVLDGADFVCNMQHKHASDLGYPEDVVFANTVGDVLKDAEDLYKVASIDAVLSKKATFERKEAINGFFQAHFADFEPLEGEKLVEKVASLDKITAEALLNAVNE